VHNNGTSPLILPDKRLLPSAAPQAGIGIQVTPAGIVLTLQMGGQQIPLCLQPEQATQVGVGLISAAAVLAKAAHDAAQVKQPRIIAPTEPEHDAALDAVVNLGD
jgi:hypothetical protein